MSLSIVEVRDRNKCGPKTQYGKRKAALNSLRHGLCTTILPCKKEDCYYYDLCLIGDELSDIVYGAFCPLEVALYQELEKGYMRNVDIIDGKTMDIVKELALLDIKAIRADKAAAMEGRLIEQIMEGFNGAEGPQRISIIYRYKDEFLVKRLALIKKLAVI